MKSETEYLKNEPWHRHWELREDDPTSIVNTDWLETDPLFDEPGWVHTDEETGIRWSYGGSWYAQYDLPHEQYAIPGVVHQVNSDNWIGENFHPNPDILALGCSISNGLGLPHNFTWPHLLGYINNMTVNVIARQGQSLAQQVFGMFAHNKKYGAPEKLCVLVPPLERFWAPVLTDRRETIGLQYQPDIKTFGSPTSNQPYQHEPIYGYKSFYPVDLAGHSNLVAAEITINYAEAHFINLEITSWADATLLSLERLYPSNILERHPLDWVHNHREHIDDSKQCSCDLKPQNKWQDDFWHAAKDDDPRHHRPHPGLHYQLHLTEVFLGRRLSADDYAHIKPFWADTNIEHHIK